MLARAAAVAAALLAGAAGLRAEPCSHIALVLSIDSSSSVEDWEFALEKQGLAAALRDPGVQAALLGGGPVKLTTLFWGDPASGTRASGWQLVAGAQDAERFADAIEASPRMVAGNTGLGHGLSAALALLARTEACAERKIVNITGDGSEVIVPHQKRDGVSVAVARRLAEEAGVIVNGLVISDDEPDIAEYYRTHVITGLGSFVMEIKGVGDYAPAIKRKIMREAAPSVALVRNQEPGTKPFDLFEADDGAGECCEGVVDVGPALLADGQAAKLGDPCEGARPPGGGGQACCWRERHAVRRGIVMRRARHSRRHLVWS
jgi:hypothetical protein